MATASQIVSQTIALPTCSSNCLMQPSSEDGSWYRLRLAHCRAAPICATSMRVRWRPAAKAVSHYVLAQAARPFLASIIIQETCRERVSSRVMFPKVPCDRPTFAATRSYWVPPRTSRRACGLRRRARAWRMRRLGRNSSALRCVGAIRRPDVTRRNHTQACERRAREALVRAGAGFHDDRCTGEVGAAGR